MHTSFYKFLRHISKLHNSRHLIHGAVEIFYRYITNDIVPNNEQFQILIRRENHSKGSERLEPDYFQDNLNIDYGPGDLQNYYLLKVIDLLYDNKNINQKKVKTVNHFFNKILYYVLKYIIARCLQFSKNPDILNSDTEDSLFKLSNIAGTVLNYDIIFDNLKKIVELGKIDEYYEHINKTFSKFDKKNKEAPESLIKELTDSFDSEDFYKITFAEAFPYINRTALKFMGNISIYPGDCAKTTGKVIYLPKNIAFFKDIKDPLFKNRNISYYVALTVHEMSHIIGGTFFLYPVDYLKKNYNCFRLAFDIHNIIEDYRCETYFKMKYHEDEYGILLDNLNLHFCEKTIYITEPLQIFLFEMNVYFSTGRHLASFYTNDKVDLSKYLETETKGNFCTENNLTNYKEVIEWMDDKIKSININNPADSLKLVDPFYSIITEEFKNSIKTYKSLMTPDENSGNETGCCKLKGKNKDVKDGGRFIPKTREDLEKIYDILNKSALVINDEENLVCDRDISEGIIDTARRTLADDELAINIIDTERIKKITGLDLNRVFKLDTTQNTGDILIKDINHKKVREMQESLKDVREYKVNKINSEILKSFSNCNSIIHSIEEDLAEILSNKQSGIDYNEMEGQLVIDRYIDSLGSKTGRNTDIFSVYTDDLCSLKVIIGIDASGSTVDNFDNEHTTILDIERYFAYIMHSAFKSITENIDVYAFNSWSSTNVYHFPKIENLSALTAAAANRDGDFIRYMTKKFNNCEEERKIFILISDGQPDCCNYSGTDAFSDTALAMKNCRKKGITLLYFNIDSHPGTYYPVLAKEAAFSKNFQNPFQLLSVSKEMVFKIIENDF